MSLREDKLIDPEYLSGIIASEERYKYLNSKIDEILSSLERLPVVSKEVIDELNIIDNLDKLISEQETLVATICYRQGLVDSL